MEEPRTNSTRFGFSSTVLAPNVRLDEPQALEQQPFEIALVRRGAQHGDGGAARLREVRALEGRRGVERAESLGDDRTAGARPERDRPGADEKLAARQAHARDLSGSSSVSGPVASAAHATARGLSRKDRRRPISRSAA